MQILISAVGRMKDKAELTLAETYLARIRPRPVVIEIDLPESGKRSAGEDKKREGEKLLQSLPSSCVRIVLDEKGKAYTSEYFARRFEKWRERGPALAFLIGGADGHADAVKSAADESLSFGLMTWPHRLVRIMLLEQIYRAQQILAGHPYHRA